MNEDYAQQIALKEEKSEQKIFLSLSSQSKTYPRIHLKIKMKQIDEKWSKKSIQNIKPNIFIIYIEYFDLYESTWLRLSSSALTRFNFITAAKTTFEFAP